MKLYVTADVHINSRGKLHGSERHDEHGRNILYKARCDALREVVTAVGADDTLVIAGDLFDNHRPLPEDIYTVISILGDCMGGIVLVGGNHEMPKSGHGPLDVVAMALNNVDAAKVLVVAEPTVVPFDSGSGSGSGDVNVVFVPYPRVGAFDIADVKKMIVDSGAAGLIFHGTLEDTGIPAAIDEQIIPNDLMRMVKFAIGGHIHDDTGEYVGPVVRSNHGEEHIDELCYAVVALDAAANGPRGRAPWSDYIKWVPFAKQAFNFYSLKIYPELLDLVDDPADLIRRLKPAEAGEFFRIIFSGNEAAAVCKDVLAAVRAESDRLGIVSVKTAFTDQVKKRSGVMKAVQDRKLSDVELIVAAGIYSGDIRPEEEDREYKAAILMIGKVMNIAGAR